MYSFHPMKDGIPAKGHSMTYLIVGADGAVLIDPGRGTAHDEVLGFIRSHDLEPRERLVEVRREAAVVDVRNELRLDSKLCLHMIDQTDGVGVDDREYLDLGFRRRQLVEP